MSNEQEIVQAVADTATTLPVSVRGFTWGAAAGWSTFVVITIAIGAFFKSIGPAKLYEIWVNRDKSLRDGKREEDVSNAEKIDALQEEMKRTTGALVYLSNAVSTAVSALDSDDKRERSRAASQARELISMAVSTLGQEDPFSKALQRLATVA